MLPTGCVCVCRAYTHTNRREHIHVYIERQGNEKKNWMMIIIIEKNAMYSLCNNNGLISSRVCAVEMIENWETGHIGICDGRMEGWEVEEETTTARTRSANAP